MDDIDTKVIAAGMVSCQTCAYPIESDLVFANPTMKGTQPYWPDNLMKRHIKPAAKAAGIQKNIGWRTFRHSFGTLLKADGKDVKTVQELLRHANSKITLDVYTQAVNSHKRAAQSKVVQMMVPGVGTNVGTKQKRHGRAQKRNRWAIRYCDLICLSLRCHIFRKCLGMYGGDDGARTRDLCRDRAAL